MHVFVCMRVYARPESLIPGNTLYMRRRECFFNSTVCVEVLEFESGKETVFIRKRAGFIKYALQHGYRLVVGYTFGESDLYYSLNVVRTRVWRAQIRAQHTRA